MTASRTVEIFTGSRHPFQLFLLVISIISGVPLVLGIRESASVESQLPSWGAFLWGLALVVGPALSLFGSWMRDRATGLILEGVGLVIVGVAAIIYAACLFVFVEPTLWVANGIVFGYGAACLVRYVQIQRLIGEFTRNDTQ